MSTTLLLTIALAVAPSAYTWWTGRRIVRSLDDPAFAELLLARQRRTSQITIVSVVVLGYVFSEYTIALLALLAVIALQYPVRRAIFDDSWSPVQFVRYTVFSFIGRAGLWIWVLVAPYVITQIVRAWIPEWSRAQLLLAATLGVLSSLLTLRWHSRFARVWLVLHQASPLTDGSPAHASLLARFNTILDRAGDRLSSRPAIYRYGAAGGHVMNAVALPTLYMPAVAMSDTLLTKLDADEATAIFAHEIAHHEHFNEAWLRRNRWRLWLIAIVTAVLPAAELWMPGANIAGVLLVFVIIARMSSSLKKHESECDLRAAELTGDPESVVRALTKIYLFARLPRRLAEDVERASSHPSLARRIQSIRAGRELAATLLGAPTVVRSTTTGTCFALDDERSYWFEGVPADIPLQIDALRASASSYRAVAYANLSELHIVPGQARRVLSVGTVGGESWSVPLHESDVAAVQRALDVVDTKLGEKPAQRLFSTSAFANLVAVVLLLASLLGGVFGLFVIPALVSVFVPTATSLAAMAAMTIGWCVVSLGEYPVGPVVITQGAMAAMATLALGAAWMAWSWHRTSRERQLKFAKLSMRLTIALLVLSAIVSAALLVPSAREGLHAVVNDARMVWLTMSLCGLGSALVTLRRPAWRSVGVVALVLSLVGMGIDIAGDRIWPSPADVAWSSGRIVEVASVPVAPSTGRIELSPTATRFMAERYVGWNRRTGAKRLFVTRTLSPGGATQTLEGMHAALVGDSAVLVLAMLPSDSLELRLETLSMRGTAGHVVWRRTLPSLTQPALRLNANGTQWLLTGRDEDEGETRLITLSGDMPSGEAKRSELTIDAKPRQLLFSYADGAALFISSDYQPDAEDDEEVTIRKVLYTAFGGEFPWSLWLHDRDGPHLITTLPGYLRCQAGPGDDALCVEEARGSRAWRVGRTGGATLLASFPRMQHIDISSTGQLLASSYDDRAVRLLDLRTRRGVRAVIPRGNFRSATSLKSTADGFAAVLRGQDGARIVLYRLDRPRE